MTKTCPKCGNGRDDMRWSFEIEYIPKGKEVVNKQGVTGKSLVEHLLVYCGRCQYQWVDPTGDARPEK